MKKMLMWTVGFGLLILLLLSIAPATAVAQAPIKIGLLVPLTGAFAQNGKDMLAGAELSLAEIGGQAAGRKIEMVVEDTQGDPATALTKARKLVEQDRVHLLTGGLLASTGYALHPYVDGQKVPATYPVMASDDLTQRKLAQWVVRTGWNTSQPLHPFGDWVAKNLKYKKVAVIGMDYAFGWESVGGFQRSFEEAGGQVIQKIWIPLNTNDLGPYLAQIKKETDSVFALFLGRLALQFVKQYKEAGLKDLTTYYDWFPSSALPLVFDLVVEEGLVLGGSSGDAAFDVDQLLPDGRLRRPLPMDQPGCRVGAAQRPHRLFLQHHAERLAEESGEGQDRCQRTREGTGHPAPAGPGNRAPVAADPGRRRDLSYHQQRSLS